MGMERTLMAELDRGTISVDISKAALSPDDMFGFAQRINPKRSFLFVSKLLGRHIPVRPAAMRETFELLANQIDEDLEGPVLFIGMAETAVGLGAGVHQQYCSRTGRDDCVFICTTRHSLGTPMVSVFEEEHSHATTHFIHQPLEEKTRELMMNAKSLVLVDDEASSGKTFSNLFASLPLSIRKNIKNTTLVTLTDWSSGAASKSIDGRVKEVSILSGSYKWSPNDVNLEEVAIPSYANDGSEGASYSINCPDIEKDWGRLGVVDHKQNLSIENLPKGKVLVLGTGEHVWQPYLLAENLEKQGFDVMYSSITRSPISLGHVINSKLEFTDNYTGLIPNYLYNVNPDDYDHIIICSETPTGNISEQLLSALNSPIVLSDMENA